MAERCPSSPKKEPDFNVSFLFRDGDMMLRDLKDSDSSTNCWPSSPSPLPDSGAFSSKEVARRRSAMLALLEQSRYREPPPCVLRSVFVWEDGFIVQGGPFRSLDDPQNARFLEDIKNSICPEELLPEDKSILDVDIYVSTSARNCPESAKHPAFASVRVGNDWVKIAPAISRSEHGTLPEAYADGIRGIRNAMRS